MLNHIQITFAARDNELQDLLIAQLSEAGFDGFEQTGDELKAFIEETKYDRTLVEEIVISYQLSFEVSIIPEQNWNTAWESNFDPVIIDDFVAIRADFHAPVIEVEQEIVITPKMSFGTGHHATTYMMVQQMRNIDFREKKVFDFGTGTGILAIVAERLGASHIMAIDNDDWSISNAAENIIRNKCNRISIGKADVLPAGEQFDIILANINKNVILDNFHSLIIHLSEKGILLLSGLLAEDEEDIVKEAAGYGLQTAAKLERNNWICLRFNR